MNNSNHTAIAIIGAGIGGLTLANGLKQKGVKVTNIQAGIRNEAACLRIYEREMIKYAAGKQQESIAYLKKMRFA